MKMDAIVLKNLNKSYRNHVAVKGLNLTIPQGELFALLGVNGAGKSTTLKMLSCLLRPTGGEAYILGHEVGREPEAIKPRMNISPQETAIAPNLSVRENLEFVCGLYGYPKEESRLRTERILAEFSLQAIASDRAKTLSGGWSRRLSIAMAVITDPQVLYLDEPTVGLDVLARRELWQSIEQLKGKCTIVLTTHYLEEAEALADRIGMMAHGELVAIGTADELKAQTDTSTLEDAFVSICGGGAGDARI
jgi:ABC-2 type transport system ATP-binding protein